MSLFPNSREAVGEKAVFRSGLRAGKESRCCILSLTPRMEAGLGRQAAQHTEALLGPSKLPFSHPWMKMCLSE